MKKAKSEHAITFTCDIRKSFRARRLQYGLTPYELSCALGIDFRTIRRWEEGPTIKCIHEMNTIVKSFLSGALGERIENYIERNGMREEGRKVSEEVLGPVGKLVHLYACASGVPAVRGHILDGLKAIVDKHKAK